MTILNLTWALVPSAPAPLRDCESALLLMVASAATTVKRTVQCRVAIAAVSNRSAGT